MGKIDRGLRLSNRQRMIRTCLNLDIDRQPFWFMFGPWGETVERWSREGMPEGEWYEPFGFDAGFQTVPVNLGFHPQYDYQVINDDGEKRTVRNHQGITYIEKPGHSTIPMYTDYPVKTFDDWIEIKNQRLNPNCPERFPKNWPDIVADLKSRDVAVQIGSFPYGLFGMARDLMGVEALLINFYDEPELIRDIMDYLTDFWLEIYKKVLEDIQIDHIHIWEDMSGKQGPLISPAMFREFMTPNYKKIVAFAKAHDISVVSVDTDGNMDVMMPLLEESGISLVLPFEVQAGCDIVDIQKKYPGICLHGGIDKRMLTMGHKEIDEEIERVADVFKQSGYIAGLDHLPHPEISYDNFCYFVKRVRGLVFG